MPVFENADGNLIAGINAYYTDANADVSALAGDGDIDASGAGIALTATWYGNNGVYLDGQAQFTWIESDIDSDTLGELVNDIDSDRNLSLSLEGGKKFQIDEQWSITPQAQLRHSRINLDRFTDSSGLDVSLSEGDTLQRRAGLAFDFENTSTGKNGLQNRSHFYTIVNLQYEFLDGSEVDVAGVNFEHDPEGWTIGLGVGGSYSWNNDQYSVYAELSSETGRFADSYRYAGTLGVKARF